MKRLLLLLLISVIFSLSAFAKNYTITDIEKIKNDKESFSVAIKKRKIKKTKKKYEDEALPGVLKDSLYSTLLNFLNSDQLVKKCELTLLDGFIFDLKKRNIAISEENIADYLILLRANNHIDDILYKLLVEVNKDYFGLKGIKSEKKKLAKLSKKKDSKLIKNNDLQDLYSRFKVWPDGMNNCVYNEFVWLRDNVRRKKDRRNTQEEEEDGRKEPITGKSRHLKKLNKAAFKKRLIDKDTFNKLEYLRKKSSLGKKNLWIKDYLSIVHNAKNRLVPVNYNYEVKDISLEDDYTQEKVKRFSRLTRRELLYKKYNTTEIIILSQILQKASRRMGVDPDTEATVPVITQEFSVLLEDGTRENYVEEVELDTQEQYNLARKRMSRDITEVQMMDTFSNKEITYNDIVAAAFETGYISFEDIEFVVQYDDLWNPELTRFQKISSFLFLGLGYTSFFLPPPWNGVLSIGLGVVQGLIMNRNLRGSENDNTASLID